MLHISASHIIYLTVCHRKLWLFDKGVELEHFSEQVLEGRLIHQTTYLRRPSKYVEIQIDGIKIDFYDPHTQTVHETKRGRSIEEAHRSQVKYYLFKLAQHGVLNASGLIEYPDLRKTEKVSPLSDAEHKEIACWEDNVKEVLAQSICPPAIEKPYCRKCAYFDLCYISE
jgi:CRISPR-associated exonuclease Cas4